MDWSQVPIPWSSRYCCCCCCCWRQTYNDNDIYINMYIYIYTVYISWDAPTLNSSHHQDYFILVGDPKKPSFAICYWVGFSISIYNMYKLKDVAENHFIFLGAFNLINKYAQGIWWVFYSKKSPNLFVENPRFVTFMGVFPMLSRLVKYCWWKKSG